MIETDLALTAIYLDSIFSESSFNAGTDVNAKLFGSGVT